MMNNYLLETCRG